MEWMYPLLFSSSACMVMFFRNDYKQWDMPSALSGKSGLAAAGGGDERAGPSGGPFPADGHTASNTPDLFRPPKLSGAGPG